MSQTHDKYLVSPHIKHQTLAPKSMINSITNILEIIGELRIPNIAVCLSKVMPLMKWMK